MSHIVITEFMDLAAVETLRSHHRVDFDPSLVDDRSRLLASLAGAEGLIVRNRTLVDAGIIAAAPRLKVVGRLGVGLDNIDLAACDARGIQVIPATGANARSVAEYVVATALVLLRGLAGATPLVAAGAWPRQAFSEGREAEGRILGIIGFGGIGRLTAQLAQGLGLTVIAHDPAIDDADPIWRASQVQSVSLDALCAEADVVSLHLPLNDRTRGSFDAARLASLKQGAILINTARGGIVDEAALAAALASGALGGAAVDVFDHEPLPAGSPLAGAPNLVLTPHIAGVTKDSNARVSALIAERVGSFLRG